MIIVNKEEIKFEPGMTIDDVLKKKQYSFKMITVIVNGEVVPKDRYCNYQINDGDNIDVLHIMSGG